MTETVLKNGEMILPSLYRGYDDFVKADLDEHCRFVRTAAEKDPDLTAMIFASEAPLLIRVAAFEHFVMPRYREDGIRHWIHDFVTSCECEGDDSRLVHDMDREKWLCDLYGIDPNWEEPHQEVPFEVCAAYSMTICTAITKTVNEALLNPAMESTFAEVIVRYPEWIDCDKLELVNASAANLSFEQMSVKNEFYRWRYYTKTTERIGQKDAPHGKNYARVCNAKPIRQGLRVTAGKRVTRRFMARSGGTTKMAKEKFFSDQTARI